MVSGGEGKVVSKDSSEFLCEGRGELRSAVGYNLFIVSEWLVPTRCRGNSEEMNQ